MLQFGLTIISSDGILSDLERSEDYTLVCILLWSHKMPLHGKSRSAQQSIIWVKWDWWGKKRKMRHSL